MPRALGERLDRVMRRGIDEGVFPGGVVLVRHHGDVVFRRAYGHAVSYQDAHTRLSRPVSARPDTVYDLASITKLFTAACVMTLVDEEKLRLDDPVADHVPGFACNGKAEVTVRQLLSHTAGLPYVRLWEVSGTPEARLEHAMAVTPEVPPGSAYVYHDTNFVVLGRLIEELTGCGLERAMAERVTGPLRLEHVGYRPQEEARAAVAATEDASHVGRGMVRGEVHDENAWSLEGVAGHAGLFGTANDVSIVGQAFLNGGTYDGVRLLTPETVAEMTRNQIGTIGRRGLGWQLDEPSNMGRLASPETYGHTGFTGTLLVVDPQRDVVVVLLTNRVHPTRNGPDVNLVRRAVADAVAAAVDDA